MCVLGVLEKGGGAVMDRTPHGTEWSSMDTEREKRIYRIPLFLGVVSDFYFWLLNYKDSV